MFLKRLICSAMLAVALLSMPQVQGSIVDMIKSSFTPKVTPQPPQIRVLLAHNQPGVLLEVRGKYKIYDPRTDAVLDISHQGKRRMLQAHRGGISWGEEFPGIHQLAIIPNNPDTLLYVDGVEYRGPMYVYDVGDSISVVNKVDVEDYLNAVLPQQYKEPLSDELLAGIAITARTSAYYSAQHGKTPFWDVDAQKEGYGGTAIKYHSKPFEKAIRKTRYMAMQYAPGDEGKFTPLAAWRSAPTEKLYQGVVYSEITVSEADKLAKSGKNAAQILKNAFPKASLEVMYTPPQS